MARDLRAASSALKLGEVAALAHWLFGTTPKFPSLPCGHDGVPDSPTGPITALCAELQGKRVPPSFWG